MAAQIEAAGQKTAEATKATQAAKQVVDEKKASDIAATVALQQMRAEYTELVAGGSLQAAAEKLQQIANQNKKVAESAEDAAARTDQAYKDLGMVTTKELDDVANKSKLAWERIKADSTASANVSREAFESMAKAAVAAAERHGEAAVAATRRTLETEAAVKGLNIQFDETGKVIVSAMGAGANALAGVGNQVRNTSASLEQQAEQWKKVIALKEKYSAPASSAGKTSDGYKTNDDGSAKGTFTNTLDVSAAFALVDKAKANKLTAADLAEAKAAFEQAQGAYDYMEKMGRFNPGGQSMEFMQSTRALYNGARSAYEKVQALAKSEEMKAMAAQAAPTTKSTTPTTSTGSTTHRVEIVFKGKTTTINTKTASEADALQALLRELGDAAGRS